MYTLQIPSLSDQGGITHILSYSHSQSQNTSQLSRPPNFCQVDSQIATHNQKYTKIDNSQVDCSTC